MIPHSSFILALLPDPPHPPATARQTGARPAPDAHPTPKHREASHAAQIATGRVSSVFPHGTWTTAYCPEVLECPFPLRSSPARISRFLSFSEPRRRVSCLKRRAIRSPRIFRASSSVFPSLRRS